jgi:hypothetical protein
MERFLMIDGFTVTAVVNRAPTNVVPKSWRSSPNLAIKPVKTYFLLRDVSPNL